MDANDRNPELMRPADVDILLRLPRGRALRLARAGRLAHVLLPDGSVRFVRADILALIRRGRRPEASNA